MFPRWIGWLFLAFLAYILYLGNFSGQRHAPVVEAAKEEPAGPSNAEKYPKLAEVADKSHWMRGVNPGYIGQAQWRVVKEGAGEGAVCGESVKVKLTGLPSGKEETHTFKIGNAPYPVLDTALEGIRSGGVREVSAPPDKFYKNPGKEPKHMVDFTAERLADSPTK